MLGCQVSTIPHERGCINSIRHQSMAQLFMSGVDKSSCYFAKMAAKSIFLTSVFALLEAGPTAYWHLRNSESVGAGPHVEFSPKKSIDSKMRSQIHRGRRRMASQMAHRVSHTRLHNSYFKNRFVCPCRSQVRFFW